MIVATVMTDIFDPATWVVEEAEDVRDVLVQHYGTAPEGLKIWHLQVSDVTDVTPADEADWDSLGKLPGPFYIGVEPQDPFTIVAIVVAVLSIAASLFLRPQIPAIGGAYAGSSTNALSQRENEPRPLKRIEDIFGAKRATPSLIGAPWRQFVSRKEIEISDMCVGRGAYDISDIREDTTLVAEINGMSVAVYAPGDHQLNAATPQTQIGPEITEPVITVYPSSSVNGQTLYAPNYKNVTGDGNIQFRNNGSPGDAHIWSADPDEIDWTDYFEPGDEVEVTDAAYNDGMGHVVNLAGTYIVSAVTDQRLSLDHPEAINADWNTIPLMTSNQTGFVDATVAAPDIVSEVGPFLLDIADLSEVWVNVVGQGGLYSVNANNKQKARTVTLELDLLPVDALGAAIGPVETFTLDAKGSKIERSLAGFTLKANPTFTGRAKATMRRTTLADYDFDGQIVDEIKWRDLYAVVPVTATDFGDVTTIRTRTPATPAALGVQSRKLNMLATRKIPARDGDGFTTDLFASKSVADIFCAVALDPFIGGRSVDELNVAQIYDEIDEVTSHFGTPEAAEFGYAFDDDSMSFEETASAIAAAAFCEPLRRGSLIELDFERATNDSVLLFNHRNKLPGSETRRVSFGKQNNNDGVEFEWIDRDNYDSPRTYRLPEDGSAVRPKKVKSVGVRNYSQMYWQAWREFQKIKYQRVTTQFDALQETALVSRRSRILVANNTGQRTQDGEVRAQAGLTLTLSQKVTFELGKTYRIFLQIPNGSVDSIVVTAGPTPKQVILQTAPSSVLALDPDLYAQTTYWIVADDDPQAQAFLLSEKDANDRFTYRVTAVNYDDRYYAHDVEVPAGTARYRITSDGTIRRTSDGTPRITSPL